ncbi:hypothetical protein L596_024589 [Steinernema carpocapsae]|uniref:Bis(5'-nucleosyl)-tetraphosphatase [asymmetrical] n=1 Tax=Steinernema carpocapsae TaxID=34508 RepID=A0A4U5MH47_STECR|nr:hypothetical protein L596_024589 [Steinernema carpocapsae]
MACSNVVAAAGMLVYRRVNATIEYLFLQASYPPYHWTPPKGHLEKGEDFYTAAMRETNEEAGITEAQLDVHKNFCYEMHYEANGKPKVVKYWLALLKNADVTLSHEHTNWKWLQLTEAVTTSKFPEMEEMLNQANDFLKKL